jgi:colicin import membrane protein
MKTGLTTSLLFHAAFLGVGLFTVAPPRAFDVDDIEALPVDIVPVESITQVQQGEREAEADETPAPTPTERIKPVEDALKTGDNDRDLKNPPTPELPPKPVDTALAPQATQQTEPEPELRPDPEPPKEPEPVPQTEVVPEQQPEQEVEPDPVAETIAAQEADPESTDTPEDVPVPTPRPKTPPRTATAANSDESDSESDQVAALLNREKAAGGGAKRATREASLGGDRTIRGSELTQSEMDALRGQIQRCWNVPAGVAGAEDLKISIKIRLDRSGEIEGRPEVIAGGGSSSVRSAAVGAARRAVLRCAPFKLPASKYDAWADVIVHFDPSDMF